jgi:hypothetical protein
MAGERLATGSWGSRGFGQATVYMPSAFSQSSYISSGLRRKRGAAGGLSGATRPTAFRTALARCLLLVLAFARGCEVPGLLLLLSFFLLLASPPAMAMPEVTCVVVIVVVVDEEGSLAGGELLSLLLSLCSLSFSSLATPPIGGVCGRCWLGNCSMGLS